MITYSIIKKSELEGSKRLDAEYYQPHYLELDKKLKKQNAKSIGEIGQVIYGTTPSGGIFENNGIPFVRSQDFSDIIIDTSKFVFCSEKFHIKNKKSAVKPGDILFAAVGATIGELAIVQDEIKEGNINQNIAAVRITDKNINPYFVGLFFASASGQSQIDRLTTGNAQPYLNSEQVKSFFVPVFDIKEQNKIADYFKEIQNQITNSKLFYSQAEDLLLEELGLKSFGAEIERELWSVVDLSEVKKANRIDAEYFQPKYQKMFSAIKKYDVKALGELVTIKKGFEPGSEAYQDRGKLFIRVSSISKDGITDKDQKYLKEDLYQKLKKDFEPKIGEILITKDASPGIAYAIKEQIEGLISGGVLRIKLKEDVEPEYTALVINSLVGQMQVERDAGGSIIAHWKPDQVKELQIPILPKTIQKKIAELVKKSHEARKKAKELLEEAKRKVEELIEYNQK